MTHLVSGFKPQCQTVKKDMHLGREREQVPKIMNTVRHKELIGKTFKSKVLENGHSIGSMLIPQIGMGGGDMGDLGHNSTTYLVLHSIFPNDALHRRLVENMTRLDFSFSSTLVVAFFTEFAAFCDGCGVELARYHTPKTVTCKSLTEREERGGGRSE